ncbi:NUDIX domain-containing protein [Candidatus Woesearchaeota archaeon]|nr:NUDIX domain-containing protein [Candidatus Woesearchaeota archaeon]
MPTKEKSAAAVVFYEKNKKKEFLLLHYSLGHWGFPKGHIEEGETEEQALLREIKEETGLKKVEIIPGFKEKTEYFYRNKKELIHKEVVFMLVKSMSQKITLSFEHIGYKWLEYEDAINKLTFENTKNMLEKAYHFIN